MSAYSDAIIGTSGLVAYYKAAEASGTTMTDSSGVAGNATYASSGVVLGRPSLLPADSSTCVQFDGSFGQATLSDRAAIDFTTGITIVAWVQPTAVRTQHVTYKFGSYGMSMRGPFFSFELSGVGNIASPYGSVVANNTYMVAGTFNGTVQTLYINGAQIATATYGASSITAGTNPLEIGSVLNLEKWAGYLAHLAYFNTGLSQATIQNFYVLGAQTAAEASGLSAQAYPFSRQVIAANASRKKVTIWNDSDTTVYLSLGGTAVVGRGPRLNGNGDRWTTTNYTGAISAIHGGYLGGKNLTITEET